MTKAFVIMTRVPVTGLSKTRLFSHLSPEQAASLHYAFLQDIFLTASQIWSDIDVFVYYGQEGDTTLLPTEILANRRILRLFEQVGEDLGARQSYAFSYLFEKGYKDIVLIGSDIPQIDSTIIHGAFESLQETSSAEKKRDIVLGCTNDGGYYLVGMNAPYTEIFSSTISWGQTEALKQFLTAIKELRSPALNIAYAPTLQDVDDYNDLKIVYEILIKQGDSRTRRFIEKERIL